MSKYTLTYEKSKSQEIYVESVVKDENHVPYFEQEYDEARKLIMEIVDSQGTNKDSNKEREEKREKIKKYGCNNRILFIGQRGCGKTSVMHSLADYLSEQDPKLKEKNGKDAEIDIKFSCLPMVDPSHFDNNNNILLTVITSMFSEAKKKMETNSDIDESAEREDLLKQFEKVFKSLDSIKSELSSYTLESLNRKSDAEDLRDKMNSLVRKFLKYVVGNKEARLVLLIDDIDMSVSYAPEMLEQLRKYLELDNLIILMSANLGQLSNEMREKYSSAFQYTLKDSNQALSIDVEDLATKYLLKLFPTSRRINVERQVDQLLKTDLFVEGWNEKKEIIYSNDNSALEDKGNFQKVILSLIWSKTRLLFIPKDPENTLHPIIPTNLRDLAQFLDMLTSLRYVGSVDNEEKEKLFGNEEDYKNCESNLQDFKNYVMKTWIPNHLKVDEELVFHNIPADITEINKHLINSINIIGTKHKDDLMSRQVGLDIIEKNADNVFIDRDIYTMVSPNDPKFVKANKISDIFNQPSNYSYGDLLLMIDKYETYFESEDHRKFTDAIKIYYSILLFETMFFKSQDVEYNYKEGNEYEAIPIQKLIGGNVYYPNYFEIITDNNFNQKGPSFDAKRAFYHKVKVTDKEKVGNTYPLFSVLYYGDIRPDRYEKDHIYDTKFSKNAEIDSVNYVTFDILSVLNNMLNPCHTLNRLDNKEARPESWQDTVDNIQKWGAYNEVKRNPIFGTDGARVIKENEVKPIPNAILPFYAVDVMLTYLRRDYSTDVLFKDASIQIPPIADAKKIANYIDGFFDDSSNVRISDLERSMDVICLNKEFFEDLSFVILIAQKKVKLSDEERSKLRSIASKICLSPEDHQILVSITNIQSEQFNIDKSELNKLVSRVWLSHEDRQVIELIVNKKGELSEKEKNDLTTIFSKEWLTQKDKQTLELIAGRTEELSDEEKSKLYEIVSKVWFSQEDKQMLEVISTKKGELSEKEKNGLRKVASKAWLSKEDKQTLISISNKKGKLSKAEKSLINTIFGTKMLEVCLSISEADNYSLMLLKNNLVIIHAAYGCYSQISLRCADADNMAERLSLIELYRNHVIALILGISLMVKKEKEALLKELHKYQTVSEIYKHLVEVLWKNAITEICIRGKIQEKVRSFNVVQSYYGKLWNETQKMLELIDGGLIDDNKPKLKPIKIYENLFQEAGTYFLNFGQ